MRNKTVNRAELQRNVGNNLLKKIKNKKDEFVSKEQGYRDYLEQGSMFLDDIMKILKKSDEYDDVFDNIPTGLSENVSDLQDTVDAFKDVAAFQRKLSTDIADNIDSTRELLNVFQTNKTEMLKKYTVYIHKQGKIASLVNDHRHFFSEIKHKRQDKLFCPDELNRPSRWIGTYSLFLKDFVKYSMKSSTDDGDVENYSQLWKIIKDVGTEVDNCLLLSQVSNCSRNNFQWSEDHGTVLKSRCINFKKKKTSSVFFKRSRKIKGFVFLFENTILLLKRQHDPARPRDENYDHVKTFHMNKLDIQALSARVLELIDTEDNFRVSIYVAEDDDDDEEEEEENHELSCWIRIIGNAILQQQKKVQQKETINEQSSL